MVKLSLVPAAAAFLLPLVCAVPYITIEGGNFIVNGTGNRFNVIGVDYQPGGSDGFTLTADPLSDPEACLRDAILMQQLGVNTIRVYNVDANLDHDQCASIFNAAGIYMILDVNNGLYGNYIDLADPASTYTESYLEHVFQVIEAFANYPNLLGFWAGNEVIIQTSSSSAPAYVRAVVRDMKDYISNNIGRPIGVGYSDADVQTMLSDTWNYLSCELSSSPSSKIDFFGLNDYEWCGAATYTSSGYDVLESFFGDTSIPVFFSEYGCNKVEPRTFTEVASLYDPSEMGSLSGGLVYMWTEDTNNYGLVDVNSSTELTLIQDYNYLQLQLDAIDQSALKQVNATATAITSAPSCNIASITGSGFPTDFSLPARPTGVDSMISSGGVPSATKGSLVSVTATTMPATVYNYTGSQINSNNLNLVQLACNEINAPGLAATYTYSSASCAYATNAPSTTGTKSSNTKSAATPTLSFDLRWAGVAAGAVLAIAILL